MAIAKAYISTNPGPEPPGGYTLRYNPIGLHAGSLLLGHGNTRQQQLGEYCCG